jgi:hypothetical protein
MTHPQPWWLTWPVAEVAATILSWFSSRAHTIELRAIGEIVVWWTGSNPKYTVVSSTQFEQPDCRAAAEGIQALEHAGLLMRSVDAQGRFIVGPTRQGMHALQTNTVRQHLGLSDAAPTV